MAEVLANGERVLQATIHESLTGTWLATLEVDSATAPSGAVTIDFGGGVLFVGTVTGRSGIESGRAISRVVGGAAKLPTPIAARAYTGVAMSTVLDDILDDAGEQLSAESDAITTLVPSWTRAASKASIAIAAVAEALDKTWRIGRDGQLVIITDTFPEIEMDHTLLDGKPSLDAILVGPSGPPLVRPGVTFEGRSVSYVTTLVRAGGLRQRISFQDDRLLRVFRGIVDTITLRDRLYGRLWPCTVAAQNADGTLDLTPDDDGIRGTGLSSVPIRYGIPGVTVTVAEGARCHVGFDNADPSRRFACLFEPDSLITMTLSASGAINIVAPDINASGGVPVGAVLRIGDDITLTDGSTGEIAYTIPPLVPPTLDA